MSCRHCAPERLPRRRQPAAPGFTLIEVLVALAILTMILGAGLEVFSRGMGAMAASEAHGLAVSVARARLDRIRSAELQLGEESGNAEGALAEAMGLRWRSLVSPYAGDELGPSSSLHLGLYAIEVEVQWDDGARTRSVRLNTLGLGAPLEQ